METYEQKYKEALERAKNLHKDAIDMGKNIRAKQCEIIFPELAESEDEKMREELIRSFKSLNTIEIWNGIKRSDILAWLEKQVEKKSADNIEPKFKVGNWIVTSYGKVNQVIAVDEDGDGFTLDDDTYFSGSWKDMYHLWSIKDTKDGDVLYSPTHHLIWIYKDIQHYYACVNMNYVKENFFIDGFIVVPADVCPATKDEQTILFAKMKEAGYEWNAEKKELNKIEDEPENYKQQLLSEMTDLVKDYIRQKSTDTNFSDLTTWKYIVDAVLTKEHGVGNYLDDPNTEKFAKELQERFGSVEQKPTECIKFSNEFENQISHLLVSVLNGEHEYNEGFVKYVAQSLLGCAKNELKPTMWSEEDEKMFNSALWHIKNSCSNGGKNSGEFEVYNWLKFIKQRIGG